MLNATVPICTLDAMLVVQLHSRVYLSRQYQHKDAASMSFNVWRRHTEESHKIVVVLRLQGAIGRRLSQPWRFDEIFEPNAGMSPARRSHFCVLSGLAAHPATGMPRGWSSLRRTVGSLTVSKRTMSTGKQFWMVKRASLKHRPLHDRRSRQFNCEAVL